MGSTDLTQDQGVVPKPRVFTSGARACPERVRGAKRRGGSNGDLASSAVKPALLTLHARSLPWLEGAEVRDDAAWGGLSRKLLPKDSGCSA